MLHKFHAEISGVDLPSEFNYPFYYVPHQLCALAAQQVQDYLANINNWFDDLGLGNAEYEHAKGKMFGVLVVENTNGELGFLAAYSGIVTGGHRDKFFVPPVYDAFEKGSHYVKESAFLMSLNDQINAIENDKDFIQLSLRYNQLLETNKQVIYSEKTKQRLERDQRKSERTRLKDVLNPREFEALMVKHQAQSMRTKFMIKEYSIYLKDKEKRLEDVILPKQKLLNDLKKLRREKSQELQRWIFSQYKFSNALGEVKNTLELFESRNPNIPPSGTGDCAAPKLLQYAFLNNLKPISIAEFWYGEPLKSRIRKHGHFYPSCRSKCEPLLNHMLKGLNVESNPILKSPSDDKPLPIIYEDGYLIAVDKPAEFLSVEGIHIKDSVERRLSIKYQGQAFIVHRLDMSTSGIMLVAKSVAAQKNLQRQFENRTVSKVYTAVLEREINKESGEISLPLRVDLDNRPFQMVDYDGGKAAVTEFKVLKNTQGRCKIELYPITGRTHQLRVHCSHPDGLNTAIVGDDLYGTRKKRLLLHATCITFDHPASGIQMTLKSNIPDEFAI